MEKAQLSIPNAATQRSHLKSGRDPPFLVMMTLLDAALRMVDTLPPLPEAILQLAKLVQHPFPEQEPVVAILERDPALAAATLRVANSAASGAYQQVTTLGRAVAQIGPRTAVEVAMAAAFIGYLPKRLSGYDITRDEFMNHSVRVGVLTASICSQLDLQVSGDPFTCGLLHDCGKLVLCHFLELKAAGIQILDIHDSRWLDAERALLGTDHTVLGEALAHAWGLHETHEETTRWHHTPWLAPDAADHALCAALYLANEQAHALEGEERFPNPDALDMLALDDDAAKKVLERATEQCTERQSSAA